MAKAKRGKYLVTIPIRTEIDGALSPEDAKMEAMIIVAQCLRPDKMWLAWRSPNITVKSVP